MAILTVGSHSTYPTIAAAMNVANSSDTISLESGYSDETATVTVDSLFVTGDASSLGIHLNLGLGIGSVTLQGAAPIDVTDNSANNTIVGNDGANMILVTAGNDVVHGGLGSDRLVVDYASDASAIIGTAVHITDSGTHSVTFDGVENFSINTGSGNDTITTGDGLNYVNTHGGDDTVTAGNGHNEIRADSGNDTITAGDGGNTIWGGIGNDTVTSGTGADLIYGGSGNDTLSSGAGNDRIDGSAGNDTISAGGGNDHLIGGVGINTLNGGGGNDTVDYSSSTMAVDVHLQSGVIQAVNAIESDTLKSVENVVGSSFGDSLAGSSGDNVITGGMGADHLNGGLGMDQFVYASAAESTGKGFDTIKGFDALSDTFHVPGTITGVDAEIASGALSMPTFNTNLVKYADASHLAAHHAVEFTPDSGTLAGDHFLIVDVNGIAGYQTGADLVIALDSAQNMTHLSTSDFV